MPITSKILEQIIKHLVGEQLEKNTLLGRSQLKFINHVKSTRFPFFVLTDQGNAIELLYIHFGKAFDSHQGDSTRKVDKMLTELLHKYIAG